MKKAFIVPLLLLVFSGYIEASKLTTVNGIRVKSYKNHTRVVVETDSAVEFTKNRLSNPDRLYFDLKNCTLQRKASSPAAIDDGILKTVRIAQFNRDTVRVVLELKKAESLYAFMLEYPHRLVIDVYDQKNAGPETKEGDNDIEPGLEEIRKIVIDPGHGGDDPGAVGPSGIQEKDIVLSVGKKLGDILTAKYEAEVIYTRDKDIFIPLNERTEIANSKKADLFISVHANASPRRDARGIETYFLNWTDDKEAMKVAARENKISFRKMEKMHGDLQMILQDLARKNKNEESMKLASSIQSAMVSTLKDNYTGIEDLGVKYALFYVLVGAEMPSILVEISFISNIEEEKRLSEEAYKNKIAEAIATGINTYITKSTLIVRPVEKLDLSI
jgi:N-acetylmuramoyl-L-alanine amidase